MKTNSFLVGAAFLHEELKRMNSPGTGSSCGYMIKLMNEMLENLISGSDSLCSKVDAMVQENRAKFDGCSSEASGKEELPDLKASSSNHVARKSSVKPSGRKHGGKGKVLMNSEQAEQIDKRLKGVEEGAEALKQAFWESMSERKKLTREIYQQLRAVHYCLLPGEKSCNRALIINSHEDEVELGCHKFNANKQIHRL